MKQPHELMTNYIIPAIKNQLVKELKILEMSQDDIAELLDVTPSAITNYVKGRRGNETKFCPEFEEKIKKTAKKIFKNKTNDKTSNKEMVFKKINKLVTYYEKSKFLCEVCKKENNLKTCNIKCK